MFKGWIIIVSNMGQHSNILSELFQCELFWNFGSIARKSWWKGNMPREEIRKAKRELIRAFFFGSAGRLRSPLLIDYRRSLVSISCSISFFLIFVSSQFRGGGCAAEESNLAPGSSFHKYAQFRYWGDEVEVEIPLKITQIGTGMSCCVGGDSDWDLVISLPLSTC